MNRPIITFCRGLAPPPFGMLTVLVLLAASGGRAAAAPGPEAPYPFEGTWTQADHVCTPTATRVRTYTARDVTSPRGRCTIRRVASGSGLYELLEECRHERNQNVTETIRMTSPDSMTLRRQVMRLKIPRQLRYIRCTAAAPGGPSPAPRVVTRPPPPEVPRRTP